MSTIQSLRNRLEQKKGRKALIESNIEKVEVALGRGKRLVRRYEKASEIVKQVALQTQKELEYHLAEQVSLALATVFDDPYVLRVEFEEKRGRSEAHLLFERRGFKMAPLGAVGGGAIDVTAFALRVAYWAMRQDERTRATLVLDEPFKGLKGEQANRRALELLNTISHQLNIQIITVSDERIPREDIIEQADCVFVVNQRKGISHIYQPLNHPHKPPT